MNDSIGDSCFVFLFAIIGLVITIVVLCWLYRINEIAEYLRRIANKLDPLPPPPPPPPPVFPALTPRKRCDCCHDFFDPSELETLDIGKTVCPGCKKFLKSK